MENKDISIVNGDDRFNFRVGLLVKHKQRVLLEDVKDFWNLIGGRVKFGESSIDAAQRELVEELGIEVKNLKLVNVSENFFNWLGKNQHEILFVYLVELDDSYEITTKQEFKCLDSTEMFKWHNIDKIDSIVCKPEIIKTLVKSNNEKIIHTINSQHIK